jgi:hypothetical protein
MQTAEQLVDAVEQFIMIEDHSTIELEGGYYRRRETGVPWLVLQQEVRAAMERNKVFTLSRSRSGKKWVIRMLAAPHLASIRKDFIDGYTCTASVYHLGTSSSKIVAYHHLTDVQLTNYNRDFDPLEEAEFAIYVTHLSAPDLSTAYSKAVDKLVSWGVPPIFYIPQNPEDESAYYDFVDTDEE